MIVGLDKFKAQFANHADQYVLIGGAACDLLFNQAGLPFRSTKDLDVVLCVEKVDAAFAASLQAFLDAAKYQQLAMHDGEKKFYRFSKPETAGYPAMIELFARPPVGLTLPDQDRYVKIAVEDALISLSALLLDDSYFALIADGRQTIDGVSVIGEEWLIPYKARAWLDLTDRKAKGETVDTQNIKKHRNDVFRLVQLLAGDGVTLSAEVKGDLAKFVNAMPAEEIDLKTLGLTVTKDDALGILKAFYALNEQPPAGRG